MAAGLRDQREIALEDLFYENYVKIPNTDPTQVMTRFVPTADRLLMPIHDTLVASDPRIAMASSLGAVGVVVAMVK